MRHINYYPDSDMLMIDLRDGPAAGGEDVADGVVLSRDEKGRIVCLEIDMASERIDLTDILADPENIVDDSGGPITIYTVSELAKKWNITSRALTRTIQNMAKAGIEVGRKNEKIRNTPIILYEMDVDRIKEWRKSHKQGRPRKKAEELV